MIASITEKVASRSNITERWSEIAANIPHHVLLLRSDFIAALRFTSPLIALGCRFWMNCWKSMNEKQGDRGAFGYLARVRTIGGFFLQVFQMFIFSCFIVFVFFPPPRHCFLICCCFWDLTALFFCVSNTSWVVVECILFYFFFVAAYVQRIL